MEENVEAKTKKKLNSVYLSKASNRPKVGELILEAIRKDGDKRGTSLALIKKYIQANYPEFNMIQMKTNILKFIRNGLEQGSLKSKNNSVTARLKIVGDHKARSEKKSAAPKKDKPKKVISAEATTAPPFGESSKAKPMGKQRKRKLPASVDKEGAPNEKVKVARKKIRKSMTVVQPPKGPKPGTSSKSKAGKTSKDPKKLKAPKKAKQVAKQPKQMAEEP